MPLKILTRGTKLRKLVVPTVNTNIPELNVSRH